MNPTSMPRRRIVSATARVIVTAFLVTVLSFAVALFAGIAGALYAFSKGSISPETLSVPRSVDGLVMVLLGGLHTLTGPVWGAALFIWLQDSLSRGFDYWRAAIGAVIVLLVVAAPGGLGGLLKARSAR